MIHSNNKMIYQPPKYHQHSNSFSHFLQLHSSINNNSAIRQHQQSPSADIQIKSKLDLNDDTASNDASNSNTSLEVVNETIGKSFTIAAILGLKKNSTLHPKMKYTMNQERGHTTCDLSDNAAMNEYNSNFNTDIIKAHSKFFQKFDNDDNHRQHNYMLAASSDSSQIEHQQQCYDNNATNSSYQEHHNLHKQHHINSEFNVNYNRNSVTVDDATTNPALRNHQHLHHSSSNMLSKAFNNRERATSGRIGEHFPSKNKSISMKNKRVRTIFTPEQLERLEAEFERQQYMVGPERLYLAHTLQLTEAQVKVWFQNRRIKWRKHHLEITQQHLAIARQRQIPLQQVPVKSKEEEEEEEDDSRHSDDQIVSDADD